MVFGLLFVAGGFGVGGAADFSFLFRLLFAPPFVVCLTFCALDFDGPVNFVSRSELVSSCYLVWLAKVFLWLTGMRGALMI